jgi:hypothetical protein
MQRVESVIRIGVVKGTATTDAQGQPTQLGVGAPKNSKTGKARLLMVQIGPQLKTAQLVPRAGEDFSPPDGSKVALLEMGGWLLIVAEQDDVTPDPALNRGEKILYGSDGWGNKRGRVKFKHNGKTFIGNSTSDLKTALTNLIQGIQGATFGGYPCVDATGKIATALIQLGQILDATE